jgi:hypothetical protein
MKMINTRNTLGTTGLSDLRAVLFGIALTVAALVLLAQQGQAQDATQEQVELTFTLFGSLVDGNTGAALPGAWVGIPDTEWGSITNDEGRFGIPESTAGRLALTIELIGYQKLEWTGDVQNGEELLLIELSPEPIMLEGLQVVTDRFTSRRNGTATSVFAYASDALSSAISQNALEFIEFQSAAWVIPCNGRQSDRCLFVRGREVEPDIYIDEMPVLGGLGYLESFAPWEFHMIEVYGGGRHIRAYTPRFMERAAKRRISPIALPF